MKLRLEAAPGELAADGAVLLHRLEKAVRPHADALADALEKAAESLTPEQEPADLRHRALNESRLAIRDAYARMLDDMLSEIGQALDARLEEMAGVAKAAPDYTTAMVAEDAREQDMLRARLARRGYKPADYEPGGLLYGLSNNELRALMDTASPAGA